MAKEAKKKPGSSKPSRSCAVMEHHKFLCDTDETYQINRRNIERFSRTARLRARSQIIRIPVVVHVLFNNTAENISLSQVESQIDALNRDYRRRNDDISDVPPPFASQVADPLIEFALAVRDPNGNATSGITRTWTSLTEFPFNPNDRQATARLDSLIKHDEFGKAAWPRNDYLNMWVCSIESGLLGYAQFPGGPASTDGVVINNTAFGSKGTAKAPFNLGRTAVHEIAHFFDLLHIWGDDGLGCRGSDNVNDTPNQGGSNGSDVRKDDFPHISCNNGPNGDMFMNYMDYVNDDTMVMFSKGQVARMNACLEGPRRQLTLSAALTPIETERLDIADNLTEGMDIARTLASNELGENTPLIFDGVSWV